MTTIQDYIDAANHGDYVAQFHLSTFYMEGRTIAKDESKAVYWARKSAEAGYPLSQYNLAQWIRQGMGAGIDLEESAFWYEQAAINGDIYAMGNIGVAYVNGEGVARNLVKGYEWIKKAAHLGELYAIQNLLQHFSNEGDMHQLAFWKNEAEKLQKAKELNNKAIAILRDEKQFMDRVYAKELLQEACGLGGVEAMVNLAQFYLMDDEASHMEEIVRILYQAAIRTQVVAEQKLLELACKGYKEALEAIIHLGYVIDEENNAIYKKYKQVKYRPSK